MDRETINEAALGLFKQRGFDDVKVSDICDDCGITKPTFYHYVPSKDDLLVTYYDQAIERMSSRLSAADKEDDPWKQLCKSFDVLIDESERMGPELLSRMLQINLQEDRHSFDARGKVTDQLIAIIRKGQELGQIKNTDEPAKLYRASAYLFQGYELLWCIRRGQTDWRQRFTESLQTLMQAN